MAGWIDRLLGQQASSADQAKERLQFVLIHDRTDLSPAAMESMKNEIIDVISRHIDIDPTSVHITLAQDGRQQRLVADIPLKPANRRRSSR